MSFLTFIPESLCLCLQGRLCLRVVLSQSLSSAFLRGSGMGKFTCTHDGLSSIHLRLVERVGLSMLLTTDLHQGLGRLPHLGLHGRLHPERSRTFFQVQDLKVPQFRCRPVSHSRALTYDKRLIMTQDLLGTLPLKQFQPSLHDNHGGILLRDNACSLRGGYGFSAHFGLEVEQRSLLLGSEGSQLCGFAGSQTSFGLVLSEKFCG